jgi:hypothetical protein
MPDENGVCTCEGTGADGCDPERQAIERHREALRQTMAEIDAATAGQTLLDRPPLPSLLAGSSAGISTEPAPLAVEPPLRWPSAQLQPSTTKPQPEKETERVHLQRR